MNFGELVTRYMARFRDSPPVFGLPEALAIEMMERALSTGEPVGEVAPLRCV